MTHIKDKLTHLCCALPEGRFEQQASFHAQTVCYVATYVKRYHVTPQIPIFIAKEFSVKVDH